MAKTQKRAQRPGLDDAGKGLEARAGTAGRTGDADIAADAGAVGCEEQVHPRDAAGYIHEMAIELKDMAESARLSFLAYLLDLVIEESAMQKRGRL